MGKGQAPFPVGVLSGYSASNGGTMRTTMINGSRGATRK